MEKIKKAISKIKNDFEIRSLLAFSFSFFINIVFFIYNLIFGIVNKSVWNWTISLYYAVLIFLRAIIILSEKKYRGEEQSLIDKKRLRLYKQVCWLLVLMDLSLIAPIYLMVVSARVVSVGTIPAITIAAYTTYKITLAIINYSKKKSRINLSIKALTLITLEDAIVSILTLQNTLVMTFGEGGSMLALTAISSAVAVVALLTITILSNIKSHLIN